VTAAVDSMSRPARDHHYQADDEKDETDGPQKDILKRNPATRRMMPRMIMAFT
jgi:hypothetical protein